MTNIHFVTYHTDLSPDAINRIVKKFPRFWKEQLPLSKECIKLLFKSCRLFHSNCRTILLSDLSTPFEALSDVEIIRKEVNPHEPAWMRLTAQIDYLKSLKEDAHVIFLDYDMLVQNDLSDVFETPFDRGLTFRETYQGEPHPYPINGGLIFVPSTHRNQAIQFLEKVHQYYEKNYSDYREWGGFQASINQVIGQKNILERPSEIITLEKTHIFLLPADIYNFTVPKNALFLDYLPEKKILHFKGARKEKMKSYWDAYLKPRNHND